MQRACIQSEKLANCRPESDKKRLYWSNWLRLYRIVDSFELPFFKDESDWILGE
jgi:hypothetical protein